MSAQTVNGVQVIKIGEDYYRPCSRCSTGEGRIYQYHYIDNGVCFKCWGKGHDGLLGDLAAAEKYAAGVIKRREASERARRRKLERELAARDAWDADNAELVAGLKAICDDSSLAYDLYQRRPLTEKQVLLARKLIREHSERAERHDEQVAKSQYVGQEGDKLEVSGKITVRTTFESFFGYSTKTGILLVIEAEGGNLFKIAGTSQWLYSTERGQSVTVRGTVKKHEEYQGVKQTVLTRTKLA